MSARTGGIDGRLTRRGVLKAGGALIVGFSLAGRTMAALAADAVDGLKGVPDAQALDTWIAIHPDNSATIIYGKCELGQGNTTGMLQIAGEELDLDMSQMSTIRLDTGTTPNQGATSSSSSIERGGPELRAAAAEIRAALLERASAKLGAPVASLTVAKGVVSVAGDASRSVTYGALVGNQKFGVKFTGKAPQKPIDSYTLVGTRVPRVDLAEKVAGKCVHMHHIRVPGMVHGRIVRPRGQGAYGEGVTALSIDESSIAHIPTARIVRKGDFVGVVADTEWDAVRAQRDLKVVWQTTDTLGGTEKLGQRLRTAKTKDTDIVNVGDAVHGFDGAAFVSQASYDLPYQAHSPFGPNCAIADVGPTSAVVQSSTQDVYASREMLAAMLGLPSDAVRVQYHEGSGTFGHSCYEDASQAAAIMSQVIGKPVRVQFMRWDELGWDQYGPGHSCDVRAATDKDGKIVAYEYHGWQHGWIATEKTHELVLQLPPKERAGGSASIQVNKNSTGGMYKIANRRVVHHGVAMEGFLRGASLRSPMDMHYCFASEQVIDDLSYQAKIDPYEFRRRNIAGERWLGVLDGAAKAANWQPRLAASDLSDADIVTGRGIGLGTHHVSFGGAVADIEVNKKTGVIRVKTLYAAMDSGLVINPALVEAQISSQMNQVVSRMLHEEVTFSASNVTSLDWQSYPVMRFSEHPDVVPVVVQRLHEPSTGAGEECMGAAGCAIANAFFDATGVRLRKYPMTPERVLAALDARKS